MVTYNVIEELETINLSEQNAADRVKECLNKLRTLVAPIIDIHKDSRIYRATILNDGEKLSSIKRLSYKDACCNDTFQRASIPGETVFYGTYDPYQDELPKINQCGVLLALYESCSLFRDFAPNKFSEVFVSEWVATQNISLFSLAATNGTNKSTFMNKLGSDFIPYLNSIGLKENEIKILDSFQNYMTNKFNSKVGRGRECEYLISAIFAEKIKENAVKKGLDGLIWESYLNDDPKLSETCSLAIFPESVDDKLQFSRCFMYNVKTDAKEISVPIPQEIFFQSQEL